MEHRIAILIDDLLILILIFIINGDRRNSLLANRLNNLSGFIILGIFGNHFGGNIIPIQGLDLTEIIIHPPIHLGCNFYLRQSIIQQHGGQIHIRTGQQITPIRLDVQQFFIAFIGVLLHQKNIVGTQARFAVGRRIYHRKRLTTPLDRHHRGTAAVQRESVYHTHSLHFLSQNLRR